MNWHLHERGFLPISDPLPWLDDPIFRKIQRLGSDLPRLVHERRFRQACADYLVEPLDWDGVLTSSPDLHLERLFQLFSYFASAYVHSPGLPPVHLIPSTIAVPLVQLACHLDRPPILAYASYCLHNWRRLQPAGPVALGNLELLQNFSLPGQGKEDEDWFILVHVDIEARAGSALQALAAAPMAMQQRNSQPMEDVLNRVLQSLQEMNRTLARMPEGCRPEVYFSRVRPYIFGFFDVVYEGCFDDQPQNFRGETGAQSSIIPTFLNALGIRHRSSLLTQHLQDMRPYMPAPQRRFVESQPSIREFIQEAAGRKQGQNLQELYNACLHEVLAFRSRHFDYAVNYIERKVSNPLGTGGTPFIPWLKQLIEETREYFLSSWPDAPATFCSGGFQPPLQSR